MYNKEIVMYIRYLFKVRIFEDIVYYLYDFFRNEVFVMDGRYYNRNIGSGLVVDKDNCFIIYYIF